MNETLFRDCVESIQSAIDHFTDALPPEEDEARDRVIDLACYLARLERLGFTGARIEEAADALTV